ncbi:MAG: hypothetical protein A2Y07_02575 [Planctomycetes bacterium GWF2_50_10]|nr:MAG: hypothetical protein A2Y07_02575 [Planctomycetes bacterium GWF2_50_10]
MLRSKKLNLVILLAATIVAAAIYYASTKVVKPVAPQSPQRIIVTSPQLTEIAYALGLEPRIAAVTSDSDYPPQAAKTNPTVGKFWQLNMEAIIAARPDLVIMEKFDQQTSIGRRLEALGYPVLTVHLTDISQLFEAIDTVGQAADVPDKAKTLIDSIKSRLITLSGRFQTQPKRTVLWVMQTEPIRVAGLETFPNELIELAGGYNAIGKTIQKYPPIGAEQIVSSAPDVIIQPAMSQTSVEAERLQAVRFWSQFPNIPAVKKNRVYVIQADTVHRLGPRLPQGLELVGRCIHPELYDSNLPDPNSTGNLNADPNDANN